MPYIQKITLTKPFPEMKHFHEREYAIEYSAFIKELRVKYADKIMSHTIAEQGELVTIGLTVWATKEDHDNFNNELIAAFPRYREIRDEFNATHDVEMKLEYEELP
jgi:hypothetical protein